MSIALRTRSVTRMRPSGSRVTVAPCTGVRARVSSYRHPRMRFRTRHPAGSGASKMPPGIAMLVPTAAMAAAIVFLRLNGFDPAADSDDWERLLLDVAASKIDREQTTRRLRKLARIFHIRSAGSRAAPSKRRSSSTF